MSKGWVYIGSTPSHLTREANEKRHKEYQLKAQELLKDLKEITKKRQESKDSQ
ncbi:hypothetical protein BSP12_023 [Bacillus phage BSP12]|nr:hypothetical protein BSP12_023 [Bacillus phage BSP12]